MVAWSKVFVIDVLESIENTLFLLIRRITLWECVFCVFLCPVPEVVKLKFQNPVPEVVKLKFQNPEVSKLKFQNPVFN